MAITPLAQQDQIPIGTWRLCQFVAPTSVPADTFPARFSAGGVVISHINPTDTDRGPGLVEYSCFVEAQHPTTPERLQAAVGASALVVAAQAVETEAEWGLDQQGLVSIPVTLARPGDRLKTNFWYLAIGQWAGSAPSYTTIAGLLDPLGVRTTGFPDSKVNTVTRAAFALNTGDQVLTMGQVKLALGANALVINLQQDPTELVLEHMHQHEAVIETLKDYGIGAAELIQDPPIPQLPTIATALKVALAVGAVGVAGYFGYRGYLALKAKS